MNDYDEYGGTWNQFENTFKQLGIEVRFADPTDPNSFAKLSDEIEGATNHGHTKILVNEKEIELLKVQIEEIKVSTSNPLSQ